MKHTTEEVKGCWVICVQSYLVNGFEVQKGIMKYQTSGRLLSTGNWRMATQHEIDNKGDFNGKFFYYENF